jgi:hypothetical protein
VCEAANFGVELGDLTGRGEVLEGHRGRDYRSFAERWSASTI